MEIRKSIPQHSAVQNTVEFRGSDITSANNCVFRGIKISNFHKHPNGCRMYTLSVIYVYNFTPCNAFLQY